VVAVSDERPDGPLTGLLHDFDQRVDAVRRHAAAEGHAVDPRVVLDSYDRTLHPFMHGRRPPELVERHGKPAVIAATGGGFFVLEAVGFAGVALTGRGDAWPPVAWCLVLAVVLLGVAGVLASRGDA
jgi:hypothetical protein